MKQTASLFRKISLFIISSSLFFASCSKDKDMAVTGEAFAGQYMVVEDDETYLLKIENKGGNSFQITEFGGFLNVPLKAVAEGSTLKIPSQTFKNPSGNQITISGAGVLSTKSAKDDTITFNYSITGFGAHDGSFAGSRK